MKKVLFALLLLLSFSLSAQTILKGDMNNDEQVTIADVTSLVNVILGKSPLETINVGGSPYMVDNTSVVGTWYAPDGTHFTLNEDGTTDYGTDFTYKFRPYQGTLMMFNTSGKPVKTFVLNEVEASYLLAIDYVTGTYTYYTNSGSLASDISLSQTSLSMNSGTTAQLSVSITPTDAFASITWTSSDESVATVDANGVVTALAGGSCTITATASGSLKTATCTVTVTQMATSIVLSQTALVLERNDFVSLTATVLPENAANKAVTWSSSNESVAEVTSTGGVAAVGLGTCTITCTAQDGSGVVATCMAQIVEDKNNYGVQDGHIYVDLGLPTGTLWATMNIGATSPEDYGDYFAWGETEGYNSGKTMFGWDNYKWCNGAEKTLTKYCTVSSYGNNGFTDNLTELETEDDAAYVNWGADWRIPSIEQIRELINSSYTTTEWTTQNGVNGWKITSKTNGNSIFLPAAGSYTSSLSEVDSYGNYRSRTLFTGRPSAAYSLYFYSSSISTERPNRFCGYSVRPVRLPEISVEVSSSSLSFALLGGSEQVSINCNGSWTASSSESWCIISPASGTGDGSLTITVSENNSTDSRSATVTVTAGALTRTISVTQDGKAIGDTQAAVDLGLPSGTLWANMNVGASSPEDYGDYFAWGETRTKTTYDWSTYFDTNDNGSTFNKYNNNGGLTELDPEDDAAYVNWGPSWRMPSEEQFLELVNSEYTTTEWTTMNGVNGRKITSRANGNSIFLPATGYRSVSSLIAEGSDGMVWSRTLSTGSPIKANNLGFSSGGIGPGGSNRNGGLNVRPVRLPEISVEVSSSSLSFVSLGGSKQVSINCNGNWTASSSELWCIISPASGTGDGSLTITVSENNSTDSRSATVTVTAGALTRTITVTQDGNNTLTAVDLGLPSGTLWANMNVGASSPEDYGDFFAWGELRQNKDTYDWSTYFDTNDNGDTFNKYNNNDGLTELELDNDAAYRSWKSSWRMPSKEQFDELINSKYTTTELTTKNGVNGYLITSKENGNSIFLPAAGLRDYNLHNYAGSYGYYWSRTLHNNFSQYAFDLRFMSGIYTSSGSRCNGRSVRPVRSTE